MFVNAKKNIFLNFPLSLPDFNDCLLRVEKLRKLRIWKNKYKRTFEYFLHITMSHDEVEIPKTRGGEGCDTVIVRLKTSFYDNSEKLEK